jgi:hypothetical protein
MPRRIRKPIRDQSGLPEEAQAQISEGVQSSGTAAMGLNGQNLPEAVPFLDQAECETVISNVNNASIVLGRDRPGPKNSGYMGRGGTQCGAIDIVVGRMGNTKGGPKSNIYAQPNFASDSARIHVSQKTDIDKNFGIVPGNVGLSVARSGIGIKADAVRVFGREGVKIVTGVGAPGECTSAGEVVPPSAYGIDLIAGNDDYSLPLEPLVKGKTLVEALKAMNARIDELNGILTSLIINYAAHFHVPGVAPSALAAFAGATLTPQAFGHKQKILADNRNFYEPSGPDWICSKHNRVN